MKKEKVADPTAPGGEEFDIDNASAEDFAKHEEILRRRSLVASLKPATPVVVVDAPVAATPAAPDPTDIKAVKDGDTRYFSQITWNQLGENHAGWEVSVAKPTDQ